MSTLVVVGAQWGDEGKGKVVDVLAAQADLVVAAWGADGAFRGRGERVAARLTRVAPLFCLGQTQTGHPRHPLYLPKTAALQLYRAKG